MKNISLQKLVDNGYGLDFWVTEKGKSPNAVSNEHNGHLEEYECDGAYADLVSVESDYCNYAGYKKTYTLDAGDFLVVGSINESRTDSLNLLLGV